MAGSSPSAGSMARSLSSISSTDASCGAGAQGFGQAICDGVQSRRLATGIHVLAQQHDSRPGDRFRSRVRSSPISSIRRKSFISPGTPENRISWRPASRTTRSGSGTSIPASRRSRSQGDSYNGLVVAFHPGGDVLASRGWNGMLRLWDIRTGRQFLEMTSGWLPELKFDRDGRRLSAHLHHRDRVAILEFAYQTECRSLVRHSAPLSSDFKAVAVDRAGRHLAAASANGITVWDLPSGTPLALLPVTSSVPHV